jgi:hypothetical protein
MRSIWRNNKTRRIPMPGRVKNARKVDAIYQDKPEAEPVKKKGKLQGREVETTKKTPEKEKVKVVATKSLNKKAAVEEKKEDATVASSLETIGDEEMKDIDLKDIAKKYPKISSLSSSGRIFDAKMVEQLKALPHLSSLSICVKDQLALNALTILPGLTDLAISCQDQVHPIVLPTLKHVEGLSIRAKMNDQSIKSLEKCPKISTLSINSGNGSETLNAYGDEGIRFLLTQLHDLTDLTINLRGQPISKECLKNIAANAQSRIECLTVENKKFAIAPLSPWLLALDKLANLKTLNFRSDAQESDEKPLEVQMILFSLMAKKASLRSLTKVVFENTPQASPQGEVTAALSSVALSESFGLLKDNKDKLGLLYTMPEILVKGVIASYDQDGKLGLDAYYRLFLDLNIEQEEASKLVDNAVAQYDAFLNAVQLGTASEQIA